MTSPRLLSCIVRAYPGMCLLLLLSFLMSDTATSGSIDPGATRRLAIVAVDTETKTLPQVQGLMAGLEEIGYSAGKDIVIDQIHADNEASLRTDLAKLSTPVVILAPGTYEAILAHKATARLPIVFAPTTDPVRQGFVKTLARPDGNMTGLSFSRGPEDFGKQLSIFFQVVPTLKRIVVFYDGRASVAAPLEALASLERVAHHLKIRIAPQPVQSMHHAARIVEGLQRGAADGVFLLCGQVVRNLEPLTAATDKANLPVFGCNANQVADGGALTTYSPNLYFIGYRAAWYVDRLFKGYQPRALPVEQPTKFEWIVNLKIAHALGISVPQKTLIITDRVIQ